jgi:sortase A
MKNPLRAFGQKIGLFFKKLWDHRTSRVLLIISGALLLCAAAVWLVIYHEGDVAAQNAEQLLAAYEQEAVPKAPSASLAETETGVSPTPAPTPWTFEGYDVIGKLTIDKISQELPVLSETNKQALKVSCCYYQGPQPGETGNLVITGHDYANGAIFGQLSKLTQGDIVTLTTPYQAYDYEVYDTQVIKPDNADALDDYEGDTVLTLMTCTSHGNRRLLVRCRPVA